MSRMGFAFPAPIIATVLPTIVGSTAAGAGTYTLNTLRYVKWGKCIDFDIYLLWTAHTGTGNMFIEGLPVAASGAGSPLYVAVSNLVLTNPIYAYVNNNENTISLVTATLAGGVETALPIDAAGQIRVSGRYFIA
jgi:hypothetical protein